MHPGSFHDRLTNFFKFSVIMFMLWLVGSEKIDPTSVYLIYSSFAASMR